MNAEPKSARRSTPARRPSTLFLVGMALATVAIIVLSYTLRLPELVLDVLLGLSSLVTFAAFLVAAREEDPNP